MNVCLGCQLANKKLPVHVVYENEYICCFLDHDPFNEGHTLIVPKKHVGEVDELDEQTANEIMKISIVITKAIKTLYNPEGITIIQNNGIFNDLSHYHMHVIPRFENQSIQDFYVEDALDNEQLKGKLADTREAVYLEIGKLMRSFY